MVDAILFDVGNVLVEWDPRHLYRKVFDSDEDMERFLSEVCTMDWHIAHDRGVPFDENAALLKARHPDHSALIDMWAERYLEMCPRTVPGMPDLVDELAARPLALHGLTNMPSSIWAPLSSAFDLLRRLDTVVISGDEKMCKPEPEIFALVGARTNMDPSVMLFVDDSLANIESADRLGFKTHHFTSSDRLRSSLEEYGVL